MASSWCDNMQPMAIDAKNDQGTACDANAWYAASDHGMTWDANTWSATTACDANYWHIETAWQPDASCVQASACYASTERTAWDGDVAASTWPPPHWDINLAPWKRGVGQGNATPNIGNRDRSRSPTRTAIDICQQSLHDFGRADREASAAQLAPVEPTTTDASCNDIDAIHAALVGDTTDAVPIVVQSDLDGAVAPDADDPAGTMSPHNEPMTPTACPVVVLPSAITVPRVVPPPQLSRPATLQYAGGGGWRRHCAELIDVVLHGQHHAVGSGLNAYDLAWQLSNYDSIKDNMRMVSTRRRQS